MPVNPTTEYLSMTLEESPNGVSPEWRPVVSSGVVEGVYEVSSTGLVSNKVTGKLLKSRSAPNSELRVVSMKGTSESGNTTMRIDKLVLEAFVGFAPDGLVPAHLDGDKANCNLANLNWGLPPQGARAPRIKPAKKKRVPAERTLDTEVHVDRRYRYRGVTATVDENGTVELAISGTRSTMKLSASTFSALAKVAARVEEMNQLLSVGRAKVSTE